MSESKINTCEKFSFDNLELGKPTKIDDLYVSNTNFIVQTPKLTINKISSKITVNINEDLENLLNEIDSKIIELLSEKSDELFEDKLTVEDLEEMYKSSVKIKKKEVKLQLNISKKLSIFNKRKETLNLDDLNIGDTIICLIKCKNIVFYKSHCEPVWEIYQIKLKEKEFRCDKYMFLDDPNEKEITNEEEPDDLNLPIKKLKIKF